MVEPYIFIATQSAKVVVNGVVSAKINRGECVVRSAGPHSVDVQNDIAGPIRFRGESGIMMKQGGAIENDIVLITVSVHVGRGECNSIGAIYNKIAPVEEAPFDGLGVLNVTGPPLTGVCG